MTKWWCCLFHRRAWWSQTSTYYGVAQFDEGEQIEHHTCRSCNRSW